MLYFLYSDYTDCYAIDLLYSLSFLFFFYWACANYTYTLTYIGILYVMLPNVKPEASTLQSFGGSILYAILAMHSYNYPGLQWTAGLLSICYSMHSTHCTHVWWSRHNVNIESSCSGSHRLLYILIQSSIFALLRKHWPPPAIPDNKQNFSALIAPSPPFG